VPLRFNSLLEDEGLDPAKVRLLRHQTGTARRTPYTLWRDDRAAFEHYQSRQATKDRALFRSPYWASFVAPPDGATLFVGVYEVQLTGPAAPGERDPLSGDLLGEGLYDAYECRLIAPLSEYIGRLSIQWGQTSLANRAWRQIANQQNKLITEVRRGFEEPAFPGFTSFIRPLSEMETMPASWHAVLQASRGVYLLACPRTREHYVGSASGADGFLGRWRNYMADGHGGNVAMKARNSSDYVVSILEVAGSSASVEEILALESRWKQKLLSRDIGLNRG